MKILGIDASHRNTGIVVLELLPSAKSILNILYSKTLKTQKIQGVLPEYSQVKSVIEEINHAKFLHGVYTSVCEIAHFGQNFGSARNVGITWGISIATGSIPYTENQVRSMFPRKKGDKREIKELASEWLLSHNFIHTEKILEMDDHQVDACCVAIYHHLKS